MTHGISHLLGTAGAAMVELALVTPVLATLVLGSTDFGRLLYSAQSVAAATRVGAEYARNNLICQQSATGVQMLPTTAIKDPCYTNIQTAMQDSRSFSPALTFPVTPSFYATAAAMAFRASASAVR